MESAQGKVINGAKHIYTLIEGDVWTIFNHQLIVANPNHPPFIIDLATGERKELMPDDPPSNPPTA